MKTGRKTWLALVIALGIGCNDALAQEAPSGLGFGLRAGLGLDPDQFVVGGQFSLGKSLKIFRVVPSVDVGFGDNRTTIDFNGDFLVRLIVEGTSFGLYGGGGPTLAFIDRSGGDSNWEFGLSLVAGLQVPLIPKKATNLEARFGIGDIPDFRLLLAIIL
ncbi:MAG: hypothetical protein PVI01_06455 [Gemmatimonadales bacterium]|jgi:hypothetical protein